MQEKNYSFEELETKLLEQLKARMCSSVTIEGYKYICHSIFHWHIKNDIYVYSKNTGAKFLRCYVKVHGNNQYYRNLKTAVYRLNDIVDDLWKDVHSDKGRHFVLPFEFIKTVDEYCKWSKDIGLATGTIKNKRFAISWFLEEVAKQKCTSLETLSPAIVAAACIKITNQSLWGEIRTFLHYLVNFDKVTHDFSTIVPHCSKPAIIPSIYSVDEIKRIENAVDRCSIIGKRDYAMLLLASRMGMRSGDIVRLKINDVKNRNELNIIQGKTSNSLHLPLIKEVKQAIADYLLVRPDSGDVHIFLNVYAPYNPVTTSTLRSALRKYINLSGVDPGKRKRGPHSLRSSLASSMVNDDISYEVVRKVLGHSSNNAIKHYVKIDIEKLRRYSLDTPKPTGKFNVFLYAEV